MTQFILSPNVSAAVRFSVRFHRHHHHHHHRHYYYHHHVKIVLKIDTMPLDVPYLLIATICLSACLLTPELIYVLIT